MKKTNHTDEEELDETSGDTAVEMTNSVNCHRN